MLTDVPPKYVTDHRHGSVLSSRLADQPEIVGARRERPSGRRSADERDELSPTDADCHMTLP
jgi:hypothetical protein